MIDQRFFNRELAIYDKDLFCDRAPNGTWSIFRRIKRLVPVQVEDSFTLLNLICCREFVFALTDTWTLKGQPRCWGIFPVLEKLRSIDLQHNERLVEEMDAANAAVDEANDRHLQNEAEAFWSDNRRAFVKATDDILVHSLSKDEPKKRLRDRSIKNGNR